MRAREIDIIRSFVIVAVVLFHSMAPFTGGWKTLHLSSCVITDIYKWIGNIAYAGMLETFVALSGYVYAISSIKHQHTFKSLALSKFRRLIVPALIWGIAYWSLFSNTNIVVGVWSIVNGIGHLWFLPMLFWCFLLEKAIVERFNISLVVLAIIAVLPWPLAPFYFSTALYYVFFFHLGYVMYTKRQSIVKVANPKSIVFLIGMSAPLFLINMIVQEHIDLPSLDFWQKRGAILLMQSLRWSYSLLIVIAYILWGYLCRNTKYYHIFDFIAASSFGVYLVQEFILKLLYYKTDMLDIFGYYLPIAGFIITVIFSFIFVPLAKKMSIDKYLF